MFAAALTCCAGVPCVALAQQPAAEVTSPRFSINRYELAGNTLIPAQDLERLVAPYTGPGKDFGDVQRALDAVEQAYRRDRKSVV